MLFAKKLNMSDFSSSKGNKSIYTTIRYIVKHLQESQDVRVEGMLEDMHVNWSIIKSVLEKEQQETKD